jgi:hypothetical protein
MQCNVEFGYQLSICSAIKENHGVTSQSHFMADSQSVSQYVLVSSPLYGHLPRYCFLFKSLGLEFVVPSLWGASSDERPGLCSQSQSYFTADSQSVSQSVSQYVLVSSSLCGRLTRYGLWSCIFYGIPSNVPRLSAKMSQYYSVRQSENIRMVHINYKNLLDAVSMRVYSC